MSLRRYTAKPATQWEGDAMPTPRPTVVCVSALDLVAVQPIAKEEPLRSEGYRRFVTSYACFDCKIAGYSQAAHENLGKGLGLKVSDLRIWPLCGPRLGLMGCHFQFDNYIERTREECRLLGAQWVEQMQQIARAAGRREFQ